MGCAWRGCPNPIYTSRHCAEHQMGGAETLEAEVIQVIRTVSMVGKGIENSAVRHVTTYWSLEGEKLATVDPFPEPQEPVIVDDSA